jgi:hypothetical protein
LCELALEKCSLSLCGPPAPNLVSVLSQRQWQRLTWIELHVEGSEQCCGPRIVAHQFDEIDQSAVAELPYDRAKVADATFLAPKI